MRYTSVWTDGGPRAAFVDSRSLICTEVCYNDCLTFSFECFFAQLSWQYSSINSLRCQYAVPFWSHSQCVFPHHASYFEASRCMQLPTFSLHNKHGDWCCKDDWCPLFIVALDRELPPAKMDAIIPLLGWEDPLMILSKYMDKMFLQNKIMSVRTYCLHRCHMHIVVEGNHLGEGRKRKSHDGSLESFEKRCDWNTIVDNKYFSQIILQCMSCDK